jgi:tetratricopeptide (TPR) repeat protein
MHPGRALLFAAAAALFLTLPAHAEPNGWAMIHCTFPPAPEFTPDDRIAACTEVINFEHTTARDRLSAYLARAQNYRLKGLPREAIADYTAALAMVPERWETLNDRGIVFLDIRDLDRAQADFNAALRINPNAAPAYANRGICFAHRERYDLAIADLDRAIALEPDWSPYYHNRALFHLLAEHYDRAEADALHALKLAPDVGRAEMIVQQARAAKAAIDARKLAPPNKARVALVIGNGKYLYGPPLPNPAHDAEDVARELAKLGYTIYGYPKTDLTRREMLAAINAFFDAAKGAESAIAWYSGHGQEFVEIDGDFGRNYVIPADANINSSKDIRTQGVALGELLMAVMPAKGLRMVLVDACRDNAFKPSIPFRGFTREGRLGMFVVYSTKPGTTASDGTGRNSPFAAAFLAELQASGKDDLRTVLARVAKRTATATRNQQLPEVVDRYEPLARLVLAR